MFSTMKKNNKLRIKIAKIIKNAGEGHIPSAYSIVDIIATLYDKVLRFDSSNPDWEDRDYFILSKGHGAAALYVVLEKYGFISEEDLKNKGKEGGILGGHPDCTKVPGAEASTGSLGHGLVTAMGIALGLKIKRKSNKVFSLIGDGESNEGTVWETALIAQNLKLGNLCLIVDKNKSIDQILNFPNMKSIWESFGWEAYEIDGHDEKEILDTIESMEFNLDSKPKVIIAHTVKGKGVSFTEGHGPWHHRIPTDEEMKDIEGELSQDE
jgi:transketolase|tara:strand:+ start:7212 stop:8012 length:801 start_codon:yes stop_codon:yes gene_type:complete